MTSSGIYQDSYEDERYCDYEDAEGNQCDFFGEVEIWFDPEVEAQWWNCPLGNHSHDEEWMIDYE